MVKQEKAPKDAVEEPPPAAAFDALAGGLDMPPPRPPLEAEAFPGEGQLTEDERSRWLVLHFALPRTIMTQDREACRTTEEELNSMLSTMAWGTIDAETSEFVLESEDPTVESPHSSLISYSTYVERMFPVNDLMDEPAREENARMAAEKKSSSTNPGEPCVKFRPMFDQLVKNLMHSNKALAKAFEIRKVVLDEAEIPEDPRRDEQQNILRFGRHQVLPAFWQLLIHLTKARRRFSLVFRSFDESQLRDLQRELRLFCEGRHPCYSGQNKTQKPPPMNGEKYSRDMRLTDEHIGYLNRGIGRLEFPRCSATRPPPAAAGSALGTAEPPAAAASPAPPSEDAGPPGTASSSTFEPTVYTFPPYHECYAGLMHHVLEGANAAAIVDDYEHWKSQDCVSTAGKLMLVDKGTGGGVAETKVQHIFFDGNILAGDCHTVDVRDVVTGTPLAFDEVNGLFVHRVDFFQAILSEDYFIRAVEASTLQMSQHIVESRRAATAERAEARRRGAEEAEAELLKALPPKEYLYRTVIPALLPALEACQRDRPADPIEFIAFYMLRHPLHYSKTLKA